MHPCVLIPEGKTDATWLRLLARITDLLAPDPDPAATPSFTHEVGVIPTKDARIADTFGHLHSVHPSLTCLVDGDQTGRDYVAQLCRLPAPPRAIIRWPDGWSMEHVIAWLAAADPAILANEDLASADVPGTISEFRQALSSSLKTNEIVHALVADAMSHSPAIMRRVSHVLKVLGAVAADRPPPENATSRELSAAGQTAIWTFNDAFPGV
jgi:hypothetical protein